jgi:hypothetical protein
MSAAGVPSKDQLIAAMTAGEAIPGADAVAMATPPEAPATGGPGKLNRNDVPPSVLAADWLPPDERWPELNELRDTHVRLRQQARSASMAVYALQQSFEAEDRAKDEALKAGFAAGVEPDLPEITTDADRASQLKDAKAISKAASAASLDHIDKVLDVFGTRYPEFLGDLDAEDRELNLEISEARARLAELEARKANTNERTRQWIERIRSAREDGLPVQMIVMKWAETPVAHASDVVADTKAAHGDGTTRTAAPASAPARSSAVVVHSEGELGEEVELADLEDEDIVDWLMGAGMFDGEPKPTVADVVGVVEPDNTALARRVLQAETTAQGGNPRQGVADALSKIIGSEG